MMPKRDWLDMTWAELHSADTSDQAQALLNAGFAKLRQNPRM